MTGLLILILLFFILLGLFILGLAYFDGAFHREDTKIIVGRQCGTCHNHNSSCGSCGKCDDCCDCNKPAQEAPTHPRGQ